MVGSSELDSQGPFINVLKFSKMAVKIRLQRHGRKKAPYYHIVIADARSPRDGKFIENIGMYNPKAKPAIIEIDRDKAFNWVMKGAQPTDTVQAILRYKGVMYRKHLQLGVDKGAITQEVADARYQEWIGNKESSINDAVLKNKKAVDEYKSRLIAVSREKKEKVAEVVADAGSEAESMPVETAQPETDNAPGAEE